jgi:hypothetical protein
MHGVKWLNDALNWVGFMRWYCPALGRAFDRERDSSLLYRKWNCFLQTAGKALIAKLKSGTKKLKALPPGGGRAFRTAVLPAVFSYCLRSTLTLWPVAASS